MIDIKEKTTGTISFDQLKILIEKEVGYKVFNLKFIIKETGDPDKGTYKQLVKEVSFEIDKSIFVK